MRICYILRKYALRRTWNPNHGWQANHEAKSFTPFGIAVVVSVHDGGVLDEVEQKDEDHESRGDQDPAEEEVPIDSESHHQFNTFVHFLSAKDPADCNGLEEDAPRIDNETIDIAGVEIGIL